MHISHIGSVAQWLDDSVAHEGFGTACTCPLRAGQCTACRPQIQRTIGLPCRWTHAACFMQAHQGSALQTNLRATRMRVPRLAGQRYYDGISLVFHLSSRQQFALPGQAAAGCSK